MAAPSRDALEHRRRVLQYQSNVSAERMVPDAVASDTQLKIPLIGEVRRADDPLQPKRARSRTRKHAQPELGKL